MTPPLTPPWIHSLLPKTQLTMRKLKESPTNDHLQGEKLQRIAGISPF